MKGITLVTLMVAGFVIMMGVCLGLTYTKYDEVTTTVVMDDGIQCTLNDQTVSNGDEITVDMNNGYLDIHVESAYEQNIGYAGTWSSSRNTVNSTNMPEPTAKSADYRIHFGHGTYSGRLVIKFADPDEIQPITLTFTIKESLLKVTHGDTEIHDGDQFTFVSDDSLTVTTRDGQKHSMSYDGHWSNPDGMSGGSSGYSTSTSMTISIVDMMYFDPGTGTMKITGS